MSLAEALTRLSIFPLPNAQLFPHALLPLHIFEPRYRDLVRDCLASDQTMAIATLEPGYEAHYHERPSVSPIIGVGMVIGHESLPEGRSNILLRGLIRARIVAELPAGATYRQVVAEPLADRVAPGFDPHAAVQTLVLLGNQLASRLPAGGDTLRSLVRSQSEPGALADVLGAALITLPEIRRDLLESVDVRARVDIVVSQIASVLAGFPGDDKRTPN
jgi:Lon protease-like protein